MTREEDSRKEKTTRVNQGQDDQGNQVKKRDKMRQKEQEERAEMI